VVPVDEERGEATRGEGSSHFIIVSLKNRFLNEVAIYIKKKASTAYETVILQGCVASLVSKASNILRGQ